MISAEAGAGPGSPVAAGAVLALVCDQGGSIREVLYDQLGLSLIRPVPVQLVDVADEGSARKLSAILAEAWRHGASLGWEIALDIGQTPEPLSLFAVRRDDGLLVLATRGAQVSFGAFEEMLRMVGEQGAELRSLRKQLASQVPMPGPELDDFTRLNNDLVNVQRELARNNLELQRQETRFRGLLRDLLVAVAVVDVNGVTRFVNAMCAAMFQRQEADLLGRAFPLALDGERLASSGRPTSSEFQRADGTVVPVEIGCVRSSWEAEPVYVVSIFDISERHQAEADRADVERILRHDLRVPLSAIISLPQVMRMDSGLSQEHLEFLDHIEAAGQRMLRMITQSLDLHRMERGEYTPEDRMTDLVSVVREVMRDLASLAQTRGVSVRFTVGHQTPQADAGICVPGGALHLSGLVANLLSNALEAAPAGSRVSLNVSEVPGTESGGGHALLTMHNLGAVPEALRPRFFEKYATYGKPNGTGLGTYSARLIARAHGGDVEFDSSDGVSTVLTVRLPLWTPKQ